MTRPRALAVAVATTWLLAGCGGAALVPAELDTRTAVCEFCRMLVSDRRLASQIVAPREEPKFFDHPSCLATYVTRHLPLSEGARIFVTDPGSGAWAPRDAASVSAADALPAMDMKRTR